eukprot:gb/GFBE01052779.1/.p1 GENE.gb/GFBE01052779.1/~~gb/GFBE01052779.1/.p1  ORF type:complete len:512 (+),score=83.36 gb/GFBE01052779.1/:1-1536(+)
MQQKTYNLRSSAIGRRKPAEAGSSGLKQPTMENTGMGDCETPSASLPRTGGRRALHSLPPPAKGEQFRSLVVVPCSHRDGTFESLCGSSHGTGKVQVKDPAVARRAVQLDLRPDLKKPHQSLFVAWDSRVVHQGHTHVVGASGWNPPLHVPDVFALEDPTWRQSLADQGYVVVADVLSPEDVQEALRLLLVDLQLLWPGIRCLDEVKESHLPSAASANDLRSAGGLCHGGFAWFLRCRPQVARFFERLFDLPAGAPLVGSVDVVALAPPKSSASVGKQWLHLDYSPPQGRIWQACLQLFPRSVDMGSRWERIALMVCKAPASWAFLRAEHSLLACCVTGAASRATAGVTLGKLHNKKCQDRLQTRGRLLPQLAKAPLAAAADGKVRRLSSQCEEDEQAAEYDRLRSLTPAEAMRRFSLEDLWQLLPPSVASYVSPLGHLQEQEGKVKFQQKFQSLLPSLLAASVRPPAPLVSLTPSGKVRAELPEDVEIPTRPAKRRRQTDSDETPPAPSS